jgi:lipopolysaccharide export system permease protein
MGSIGRYIFRTTFGAFVMILGSLTAVIWVTQALREIDLMTTQGQTILIFIGITLLIIPMLILLIAPIALVIGASFVLNKLSTDSEIIVMNAAGMSPWRMFRAFLAVSILVSVIVAIISAYLAPKGMRELRSWATDIRADIVTNLVKPGRFIRIERNLILHVRERRADGELLGIFVDDSRDEKERSTFLAQRGGILENDSGTFLVLENGNVQRQSRGQRDPAIVTFDRYAFDLSQFALPQNVNFSVRERYLWELINPDPKDPVLSKRPEHVRAELADRLAAPLYPIAFVIIAYAYLGAPRTTRQSRTMSIVGAILAVTGLRLIGFGSIVTGVIHPVLLALPFVAILASSVLGLWVISRGVIIEPPAFITNMITVITQRLTRRTAPA